MQDMLLHSGVVQKHTAKSPWDSKLRMALWVFFMVVAVYLCSLYFLFWIGGDLLKIPVVFTQCWTQYFNILSFITVHELL